MAPEPETVRLQFDFDPERLRVIEALGEQLGGHSAVRMAGWLIEAGLENEEWAVDAIIWRITMVATAPLRGQNPFKKRKASGELVHLQVPISRELAARLERFSKKRDLPQGKVAASLLDRAIDDEKWIIDMVTSRIVRLFVAGAKKMSGAKKKAAKENL